MILVKESFNLDIGKTREIDRWSLIKDQEGLWRLQGITVSENGKKLDFIRFTTTSPIIKADKRGFITESNSIYILLHPSNTWLEKLSPPSRKFILWVLKWNAVGYFI